MYLHLTLQILGETYLDQALTATMPCQTERQKMLVEFESVLKIAILEENNDDDNDDNEDTYLFEDLQELFEDETDVEELIEFYQLINASRFLLPRTSFAKTQDFVKEFFH